MKESRLRKLVRQEIINKLDKVTEGEDPFVPTYGKGDVVHDCPKHVQEIKTGIKGKVTGHTLNESGDVNFVDVDFGTGKIFENIPTKKLKVLEMQEHHHEIKEEPETPVHDTSIVEDLKVKAKKDNEMGSSLGYRLTKSQHSRMLAFLKKNKNNPHVKRLLGTLGDKYSDSVSITLDNRPFFVYGSYGQLRIGSGGKVSQWNDTMKKALTKYIGEAVLYEKVTPSQVSKAFDNVAKVSLELIKNLESYKKAKSSGNEADIKKYTKMAGDLTKKKKAAEASAEKMIQALDKDAKLVMNEISVEKGLDKVDYDNPVLDGIKITGVLAWDIQQWMKQQPDARKLNKGRFRDLVPILHKRGFAKRINGANLRNWQAVVKKHIKESKLTESKSLKQYSNKQLIDLYKYHKVSSGAAAYIQAIEKELKNRKVKLTEAPMDTRFQKEWERNCKVLITHLKHEQRGKLGAHKGTVKKMIDTLETVQQYPKLMGSLFGTNEGKFKYSHDGKLREAKTRLDEKFGSRKLSSLFAGLSKNRWSTGREFLNSMSSKHGIQWDKITDDQVKGPDKKLDRKGIDLIVATKDVEIPASSTYDYRTRITKGQLLSVTINGKRVWLGRGGIKTGGGRDRSFVGLDKRGYSNVRDVLNIDGAVVYHVDPSLKSRGATDVRADRAAAKAGATAMMDAKKVKQDNITRYRKALQIKAGKAGKGPIIKMLETATKMYEKALQEKLTKMKQGFIPRDSWYADTVKTIGHRYGYMIRAFEEYMRAGANVEAVKAKYKDDPEKGKYSVSYEENTMASKAKEVKDEFNKLKSELSKLDKANAYVDVKTLGRAY